jgi:O-antigen/teichoic acid export membrane protein
MATILDTAAKNTTAVFLNRLISMVCTVVFLGLFSRYVGVTQFGQYSYTLSLAYLLAGVVLFGLDNWALREMAQFPARSAEILGQSLFLQGSLTLLALLGLGAYWLWIRPDPLMLWVGLLVAGQIFLDKLGLLVISLFRAQERMEYETLVISLSNLVLVLATAVGIYLGATFCQLLGLITASYLLRVGLIFSLARWKFGLQDLGQYFRPSWTPVAAAMPFFLMSMGGALYETFPRLILGTWSSLSQVGLYAAAEKVVTLVILVASVMDVVLYPLLAKKALEGLQETALVYQRLADLMMASGLIIGILLAGILPEVIWLIFGREYLDSAPVALLLVPAMSLALMGFLNTRTLTVLRQERLVAVIVILGDFLGIALALVFVKTLGARGMALTLLCVTAASFLFCLVYIRGQLKLPRILRSHLSYLALFALSFALSWLMRGLSLPARWLLHGLLALTLVLIFSWTGLLDWSLVRNFVGAISRLLRTGGRSSRALQEV